jgi:Starch-binding associating with outer membrane
MKTINIKKLAVLPLALGLIFTSCKRYSSDFGDTNINPGVTGSPLFNALMTNALVATPGYAAQTRGGLYCQYFSETQYTDVSLYSIPQLNFEGNYSGVLNDLQNIINNGPNDNMKGVARIVKTYIFSNITDAWGDVPYSQALTGNGTPAFDRQSDIYTGMLTELAAAVNQLGGTGAVTGDIIYGGNVQKWQKFGNSLRMRLAIQLSKKYPTAGQFAATQFNAALNHPAGFIASNSDNCVVNYPGGNFSSPWWGLYNGRRDFGESDQMTALMSSLTDGRQTVFGGKTEDQNPSNADWNQTSALGVPYGRIRAFMESWTSANPTWARILRGDKRVQASSVMILSASETFLHRAEAADRGWTAENLSSMYQQGINASFEQWGLAAPSAAYFTQASVAVSNPAGTGANIKNIAIQQYVAAYPDGQRGWNIWRRTGWPTLTPAADATNTSRQIPQRWTYGQSSYGSNTANVNAAASAIGGDNQDTKVWWAQ